MEKQKKWHFYLILAVVLLTLYNILPTLFFYANPLKETINASRAEKIASHIVTRVNHLEDFTVDWLTAQAKNLNLKPEKILILPETPKIAKIYFRKQEEANLFAKTLFRAGALIAFAPAELVPADLNQEDTLYSVTVQRKVGVHIKPEESLSFFHFVPKKTEGHTSEAYRQIVEERALRIATLAGGVSESSQIALDIVQGDPKADNDNIVRLGRTIIDYENIFGEQSSLTKRYFASLTQNFFSTEEKRAFIAQLLERFQAMLQRLNHSIQTVQTEKEKLQQDNQFLASTEQQKLEIYANQKNIIQASLSIISRNQPLFEAGLSPLTKVELAHAIKEEKNQTRFFLGERNPFVDQVVIDWNKETIELELHKDVQAIQQASIATEMDAVKLEKLNTLLFNAIGAIARFSDEKIQENPHSFTIALNELTNSQSLLVLDMAKLGELELASVQQYIQTQWKPTSELEESTFPHFGPHFNKETLAEKEPLGLIFFSPLLSKETPPGFHADSLYVIVRGFEELVRKYEGDSSAKTVFDNDFSKLASLLQQMGFSGYPATKAPLLAKEFQGDFIFELENPFAYFIGATREKFSVKGKKRALLEFTNVEQRLLTSNKIETEEHEDLIKWKDAYQAAHITSDSPTRFDVPSPNRNVFFNNLYLSTKKYFRGDERKILQWGLDLSGGKTVRVGLKDQNNQAITNENDIREAINELYARVNKLGVSEVSIRQEGANIVLDFPGSQGLSAQELIKASAMYFHVVNEKFSPQNPLLREALNSFLEGVWNEAVITNRKDSESVNQIAWEHLGGTLDAPSGSLQQSEFFPKTSYAKMLYDNGLRIANPQNSRRSSTFDDTLSQVTLLRGDNFTSWQGQTHPLLIVFNNYALEGSNLTNVSTGYDSSEGNVLYFGVKNADVQNGQKVNPRDDFHRWTSQFSEEKIAGTPKESYSQGRGWRMAVILNGSVVSAPALNSALRDSARITGHFSQREVNTLAADLKAGSLSFTPSILSEENVSPDLGKEQRMQGIMAAALGVLLVVIAMCLYYRFGGVVASVAVLFNLIIIWAVLQNLGAALTLAGIAGVILTVGMAVDANVLVFERIREEFAKNGRLPSAIQVGYRKAFSAILDSNLTTIIAAVILLNFDSGPIKGFALTLIIGIASSMFTSLFMTRYFFARWVQNPRHTKLSMARLFQETSFNFLNYAKPVVIATILLMVTGTYLLITQRNTIFGMDFTGGYALTLDLQEKPNANYRLEAEEALLTAGAAPSDFQIRELTQPNRLRIQLGMGMEEEGKPFYHIEEKKAEAETLFVYQNYPKIVWIVNALEKGNLTVHPASLSTLNLHWTQMSGQLSDTMRNQAAIGLLIAFIAILIYITFRFEFHYAISATIGLAHDVLITMGILGLAHLFFQEIQIDLQVIAAIMTIVGYSLNDTIIIFDRIREDIKLYKKLPYKEIVNKALNATLSRTLMTSGTTLLVLLALLFLGGKAIFNFALIMTIGVIIGTLSSLFVAAPLLVYFHKKATLTKRVLTH